MREENYLQKLKGGNENALEWFINRYGAYVSTIIYNIVGNFLSVSDIEEVASDVFYTLWKNADRISHGKVKAYLGGVARNKAKERIRKSGEEIPLEDDIILISRDDPLKELEESELAAIVREAVLALESTDREIFLRHYYYYQKVEEIAEEMRMNPSTVKTRLRRGREKLKKRLMEGGYFDENENF